VIAFFKELKILSILESDCEILMFGIRKPIFLILYIIAISIMPIGISK